MIVDDEDNLRSMLAAALRHNGFDISSASNGREALDVVASARPDLVILDVMMPDIDGSRCAASRRSPRPMVRRTRRRCRRE